MQYFWQELTDMESLPEAVNEMTKRYKDTVLCLANKHVPNKVVCVSYEHFTGGTFYFISPNGNEYKIGFNDLDLDVFVPKPRTGCYTSYKHKTLVVLTTLPHRQWKRGLCKQNTYIVNAVDFLRKGNYTSNIFGNTIQDILEDKSLQDTRTIAQAIIMLSKGYYKGVSLTRDFGVTLNFFDQDNNKLFLFHHNNIIGHVKIKEKVIVVENDIFLQEVLDTKQQWAADFGVTLA